MLLGVPSAAADVGGVSSMMTHEKEGFLYPSSAPYMLASFINEIFAMEERAEALGTAARTRAFHTHDPKTNLESLLSVYKILSGEGSL